MLRTTDETFIRMKEELHDLQEKIQEAEAFVKLCRADKVKDITLDEIHMLEEQLVFMRGYAHILTIRIFRVEGE